MEALQRHQHMEVLQEIGDAEEADWVISTSEIKEILGMWEKLSDFIPKKYPEKVATGATTLFNYTCSTAFRKLSERVHERDFIGQVFIENPCKRKLGKHGKKGKNQQIRFSNSVQPFSCTSVSIFKLSDLQGKCYKLYLLILIQLLIAYGQLIASVY